MFRSGFSELEITPHLGSHIPGYFHRRLGVTVLDRLFVSAWVTDDGNNTLAIASVDCHGLSRAYIGLIKHRIRSLCGIRPENVLIACTHTHSGGPTHEHKFGIDLDAGYLDFIVKRVADCVALAWQDLAPSAMRLGKGWLDGYSFCRIFRMRSGELQTNPRVPEDIVEPYRQIDKTVIAAEITRGGRVDGILVSFACHCDTMARADAFSTDYPGAMAKKLKEHYGEHVKVLFLQGPSGNINHIDKLNPQRTSRPEHYVEFGEALAKEVCRALERAQDSADTALLSIERDITIPMRLPNQEELAQADVIRANVEPHTERLACFDKEQMDLHFANTAHKSLFHRLEETTTSLQVMKIGDLGIYTSPGELFSEFGDELVGVSPFAYTAVATFANDYIGYIVAPGCMTDGVYEYRQTDGMTLGETAGTQMNRELIAMGQALAETAK